MKRLTDQALEGEIQDTLDAMSANTAIICVRLGEERTFPAERFRERNFQINGRILPVRTDENLGPDEWALVMGPLNREKKKAEDAKELTKDLHSFLEVIKNPTIVYRNEDILKQLTRAVLILLERTEPK